MYQICMRMSRASLFLSAIKLLTDRTTGYLQFSLVAVVLSVIFFCIIACDISICVLTSEGNKISQTCEDVDQWGSKSYMSYDISLRKCSWNSQKRFLNGKKLHKNVCRKNTFRFFLEEVRKELPAWIFVNRNAWNKNAYEHNCFL